MTFISIKISKTATKPSSDSIIVYAVKSDDKGPQLLGNASANQILKSASLKGLGVTGSAESAHRIPASGQTIGLIGVGTGISSAANAREIGGAIGRSFNDHKTLILDLPINSSEELAALLEGIAIVQYEYNKYKSSPKKSSLKAVELVTKLSLSKSQLSRIKVMSEVLDQTRDLVNAPANDLYPSKLADIIKSQGKIPNVKVEVWDEKKLAKEKCHGILAVGQGSARITDCP